MGLPGFFIYDSTTFMKGVLGRMGMREIPLRDIHRSFEAVIRFSNPFIYDHSTRVSYYSCAISRQLGLTPEQREKLYHAAFLHDIGKLGIPAGILVKPEKLNREEYRIIKTHPLIAAEILSPLKVDQDVLNAIIHHHERPDGLGYPHQLHGDEIPLESRIIAVADSFDAMTSNRPYRHHLSWEAALQELVAQSGKQFDEKIVAAFLACIKVPSHQGVQYSSV
jgi:putative nucleotidyltransferase with HDIG domain